MGLFSRNLPKLAQTQETFDAQADEFLANEGFPVNDEYRMLYGTFVQHSGDSSDTLDINLMAQRIRKAKANEFAFYLIQPKRRPKPPTGDDNNGTPSVPIQNEGV